MSAVGSIKQKQVVATGQLLVPGVGPYLPQGAAKQVARPMYRGGPPKPTGVFDSQTEFPPTKLSELYNAGTMPCRVELVANEDENSKTGRPKGGRTVKWLVPVSEIELDKMLPIFVEGLREKMEP